MDTPVFLSTVHRRVILLYRVDLLLFCLGGIIPALSRHLVVDLVLHRERIGESGIERHVYALGSGLHRAVHIQVAAALFELQ